MFAVLFFVPSYLLKNLSHCTLGRYLMWVFHLAQAQLLQSIPRCWTKLLQISNASPESTRSIVKDIGPILEHHPHYLLRVVSVNQVHLLYLLFETLSSLQVLNQRGTFKMSLGVMARDGSFCVLCSSSTFLTTDTGLHLPRSNRKQRSSTSSITSVGQITWFIFFSIFF